MRTADIILKTYPLDYDWLPYLFRSLEVYRVTGYRNVILILEEQYPEPPNLPANAVIARSRRYVGTDPKVSDKDLSGRGAVMERLSAFKYTDAEVLIYVDSDHVFTRDIDFQSDPGICIDKPAIWWRTWEEAGIAKCWLPAATETLGYRPKVCTMCHSPQVHLASVMRKFWEFIGGEKRFWTLHDFTDWDAIGNYALDYHPDLITAVNASDPGPHGVPGSLRQFWSWHRANHPEVRAAMRGLGLLGPGEK
jgi:hypothetical protein